jgi:GNAT superfamily N-acetyltransferase
MIEIIRAEEKHVTAIGKLWWELMIFHQNIDHIFTPVEGSSLSFEENMVRRLMRSADGLALVALDDAKVVGFSLAEIKNTPGFRRGKLGFISDMAVLTSHRRRGIGGMILKEIPQWCVSKNITRVELQTAALNAVSNSFWEKQSFEINLHTRFKEI